ncbi:hypothetical protein [Thermosulfuriphilus sp.]
MAWRLAELIVESCPGVRAISRALKEIISQLDPVIEGYTRLVCPQCVDICCSQTNAFYDFADMVVILAGGAKLPVYDHRRSLLASCQFMGPYGCHLPRWRRPYRCTWYFCEPLIKKMEKLPAKEYRRLLGDISRMQAIRRDLLESLRAHLARGSFF